jgi:predicted TIM-barrel fold metal-dependent hydrolase
VLIDTHTHNFPPDVRDNRETYLARDATFLEMYSRPEARIATADDLLASMDEAGIDISVACSFAWTDAAMCTRHNDYVLEAAARSAGRIIAFCAVQALDAGASNEIARCAGAGARGLGELRPESQGYSLDAGVGELLADGAREHGLILLFHVTEPVGHLYPGKHGLAVEELLRFVTRHPDLNVVGAHWGGGLPYHALLREHRPALQHAYVDTAGTPFLYRPEVYALGPRLLGVEHVLFASDFPLVSQQRALAALADAPIDASDREQIAGKNARALLGLV